MEKFNVNFNRVLFTGDHSAGKRNYKFCEGYNLSEFEAAIVRPSEVFEGLSGVDENLYVSNEASFRMVKEWITSKIDQLITWVENGGILIVTTETPRILYNYSSGYKDFNLAKTKLFEGIHLEYKKGELVELYGAIPAPENLQSLVTAISYENILKNCPYAPILKVSRHSAGQDEVVGAIRCLGKGRILFLPTVEPKERANYYAAAIELGKKLPPVTGPTSLPSWTRDFVLHEEAKLIAEKRNMQRELDAIHARITTASKSIEDQQKLKELFGSTGDQFADAARDALSELGIIVEKGPTKRADLIGIYGDTLIGIEAKGLDGAAKEADLRQADRWKAEIDATIVSTEIDRKGDTDLFAYGEILKKLKISLAQETITRPCKGVMVIGTFRKMPLSDRTEPSFSAPLAQRIKSSRVCAITGLQLLGLLLRSRSDPSTKDAAVRSLLDTEGVFEIKEDWSSYLAHAPDKI